MGETYADVVVRANDHSVPKRLLVDTGATFSWISSRLLRQLGVQPARKEEIETIEGKAISRWLGQVEVECLGRSTWTWVVFGYAKDAEVLGLHALEGLCLDVDPAGRRLKKVRAIRGY